MALAENSTPGMSPISSAPYVDNAPVADPVIHVNQVGEPAQTTGPPATSPTTTMVHETHFASDHVITDPHSELAVQIPMAGRGNAMTPMGNAYGMAVKPEHPEASLKRKSEESDSKS